jgi:hypothetical protein
MPDARAVTIASWDTFGQPGDQVFTAGAGSPNVTADNMVRGSGLGANTGANSMNSSDWDEAPSANPADDLDYIQFGFDVDAGYCVVLDQLIIGTRSSNTGPGTVGIFTSLDGFAAPVSTLIQPGDGFLNSIIDLSGLGQVAGAFDVRLIEIGNTQADGVGVTGSTGTFRVVDYLDANGAFSDTQITGRLITKDVPDAGSTGLLGLLALGGLAALRRFWRW